MIIYLFFIFTCGWCVCYLLFLNYQQYAESSPENQEQQQAHIPSLPSSRECLRRFRRRWQRRRRHHQQGSDSYSPDDWLEEGDEGDEEQRQQHHHLGQVPKQELVVDEEGECSLIGPDCCDSIMLNCSDYYDSELLTWSPQQPGAATNHQACAQCEHSSRLREAPAEMRGWPEELQHVSALGNPLEEEEDDGEQVTLWPLVELHENPLGTELAAEEWQASASGETTGVYENEGPAGAELALRRSQLLSLQASQQDKRAAIRMISSDSVQLLVAASHQHQLQLEQELQQQQQSEQKSSSGQDEGEGSGEKQQATDLLMMQATASVEKQQDTSKQSTTCGRHPQAAAPPTLCFSAELQKSAARPSQSNNDIAGVAPTSQVSSRRSEQKPVAGAATTTGGSSALAGRSQRQQQQPVSMATCPPSSARERQTPLRASYNDSMTAPLASDRKKQQAAADSLSQQSGRCASGEFAAPMSPGESDSSWAGGERQSRARMQQQQSELQVQAAISSQELPTLQQLQHQIQERRAAIAAATALARRQAASGCTGGSIGSRKGSTGGSSRAEQVQRQQQQRMQQWTAAASMVQQRQLSQQQQHQQQREQAERRRPGNGAASAASAAACNFTTTDEELEQTPTSAAAAAATTTTISETNKEPLYFLLSPAPAPQTQHQQQHHQVNYSRANIESAAAFELNKTRDAKVIGEPNDGNRRDREHLTTLDADGSVGKRDYCSEKNYTKILERKMAQPVPHPRAAGNHLSPATSRRDELASSAGSYCNQRVKKQTCPSDATYATGGGSSVLITDAAMDSSELIPQLVERLGRKLVVMKEEQLSLMREIELNETSGKRLYESMKRHLSALEFEKITMHANEIEKVTKLILSLKMRLKRVESELKDRIANRQDQQQQQHLETSSSRGQHNITTTSSIDEGSPPSDMSAGESHEELGSGDQHTSQSQQKSAGRSARPQQDRSLKGHSSQMSLVRGVSDPTGSTGSGGGLAKRNHQHRASLQVPDETSASDLQVVEEKNTISDGANRSSPSHHQVDSVALTCSNDRTTTTTTDCKEKSTKEVNSCSSDSIFNCADSAIGSSFTAHGGSATNIEQPGNSSQSSLSSLSSTQSSLAGSSADSERHEQPPVGTNHNHLQTDSPSHLASAPLVSPSAAATTTTKTTCNGLKPPNNHHQETLAESRNTTSDYCSDGAAENSHAEATNISTNLNPVYLLTDIDLLYAKRNKLISQLEEAHQLEDCIADRNKTIVQRILKKYYQEDSRRQDGEIAEFGQFCRLKSLLLKDSHDVSDRIDNAELQLLELRKTNRECNADS